METTLEYENLKHGLIQLAVEDFSLAYTFEIYDADSFQKQLQEHLNSLFKFDVEVYDVIKNIVTNGYNAKICLKEPTIQYSNLYFEVMPTGVY